MSAAPDQPDRRHRGRVPPRQLDHSHHRGDRVGAPDRDVQFVIEVAYDGEEGVSYALSEDRLGETMDAIRHFVEKAATAGGEMKIRIAPREGDTGRESELRMRRATDAPLEEREERDQGE